MAITAINITNSADYETMAEDSCGPGMQYIPASSSFTGDVRAVGFYSNLYGAFGSNAANFLASRGIIGLDSGFVISTGLVTDIRNKTTIMGAGSGSTSTNLAGSDSTAMAFSFIPHHPIVVIPMAFGSEEYPEFINSAFRDFMSVKVNTVEIGYLPDWTTRISIANVNASHNSTYFSTTSVGGQMFDGMVLINILLFVPINVTCTIQVRVEDVTDELWDSGLFLGTVRLYPRMYADSVSASGVEGAPPNLTDLIAELFPQTPAGLLPGITAGLLAAAEAAGALIPTPPPSSRSLWKLHRFDIKPRAEERA